MTLWPALSDNVTIQPKKVFILWHSDPTGVGMSDHPQTALFFCQKWVEMLAVTVRPVSQHYRKLSLCSAWSWRDSAENRAQMVLIKNSTLPPDTTPPMHGSARRVPWPNLIHDMVRHTQQNSTRLADPCVDGVPSSGESNCHKQDGQIITVTIRPLRNLSGQKI
jgi:hypothetical protein